MSNRIEQLKSIAAKKGVSAESLRPSTATFIAERAVVYMIARVYDIAGAVAGIFEKPVRNDLSLLAFEMQALSSFMSLVEFEPIEDEMNNVRSLQSAFLMKMHDAGFESLDLDDAMRAECVSVNSVVTEFAAKIHALYRERVRLGNIL